MAGMNETVMLLYQVLALIFAVTGIVTLRKRSSFPDTRAGYHGKEAVKNKENWEYANGFCGKLCLICAVVFLLIPRVLMAVGAGNAAGIVVLIAGGALAAAAAVLLPAKMLRRRNAHEKKK